MKKLLIVKIGGGLLTDKSKPYQLNQKFVDRLTDLFPKKILDDFDVIIGTGAGSFGHYEAKKHGLTSGVKDHEQLLGACKTHLGVQRLNRIAVEKLLDGQMPAFSISPSALFTSRDSHATQVNIKPIRAALANNLMPVIHGETVIDDKRGIAIFSTERSMITLLRSLAKYYDEVSVILLTNPDGVLVDGKTLPIISTKDALNFSGVNGFDVTGGMRTKVDDALALAKLGAQVTICSGHTPNIIGRIINGEQLGTLVAIEKNPGKR
ncbi:isopentenyl phosphate kinase [Candidatus Saccharibacteria bacterium]|nr:isopentenyl phosphate kinase [Candidatus Saccharibacteria bacterium]